MNSRRSADGLVDDAPADDMGADNLGLIGQRRVAITLVELGLFRAGVERLGWSLVSKVEFEVECPREVELVVVLVRNVAGASYENGDHHQRRQVEGASEGGEDGEEGEGAGKGEDCSDAILDMIAVEPH
jgi:hypothetical protein